MDKEEKVLQYKTIKRLQKNYLVRCNESLKNIIPGNGVKPVSLIRRIETEIKLLRHQLGQLLEEELLNQMDTSNHKRAKEVQEQTVKRAELMERIRQLEKQLLEYELL